MSDKSGGVKLVFAPLARKFSCSRRWRASFRVRAAGGKILVFAPLVGKFVLARLGRVQ
jgi:hypothetical protein